jgi:hypothetical protein
MRDLEPELHRRLRTVKQLSAETGKSFTEGSLRWLIFNAQSNGLSHALIRVGGRVRIDLDKFNEWLANQRAAA